MPGVAVLGGSGSESAPGEMPGDGSFEINEDNPMMESQETGRMPAGAEIAATESGPNSPIPEDIPDPQGDDIVAQQLREAAIAETDPELKEKLWEEYKKYRASL